MIIPPGTAMGTPVTPNVPVNFKAHMPGVIMLQRGATETITALLDTKDQSAEVRAFLNSCEYELARLGTLAY